MEAQRKAALWSVLAALALIALKLGTGLATHSLGLISEAAHSGTDLIAALLSFFALGVAVRPADPGHQYGHGKAEHLAALAEGAIGSGGQMSASCRNAKWQQRGAPPSENGTIEASSTSASAGLRSQRSWCISALASAAKRR